MNNGGVNGSNRGVERSSSAVRDADSASVGFSDLPNQIHRKTVKKGFEFTLMIVGGCCFMMRMI